MLEKKDLDGVWQSEENEKVENPDGIIFVHRRVTFHADNWEVKMTSFADQKGELKLYSARGIGKYSLVAESKVVEGATDINLQSESRFITIHHEALLELFRHACRGIDWKIDEEVDVSKYGCLSVPSIEKYPIEYDIVKILDHNLYFGDYTADQKEGIQDTSQGEKTKKMEGIFHPENRPNILIGFPLIKKQNL
jgi:hypothetical protein